jgi:hypothetical protein
MTRHAGIANLGEIKFNERPGGDALIEYSVEISKSIYERYLDTFSGEEPKKKGRKRDQMPEGWLN